MKPGRSGSLILIPFAIFWCSITGVFDYALLKGLVNNLAAVGYQTGQATITESRLEQKRDSDGDLVDVPHITYRFTAQGRERTSTQIRYGLNLNSNNKQLVKDFSRGAQVPVYYAPSKPEESVLVRGEFGPELGLMMFLTPFNLVGLALILGCLGQVPFLGLVVEEHEIRWIEKANETRVTLHRKSPVLAAAVILLGTTFLGTFGLLGLTWLFGMSNGLSMAVWSVVLWLVARAYLQSRRDNADGKGNLVLRNRVLEFWPMPLASAQSRHLDQLTDLVLETEERKDSEGDKQTWWVLSLSDATGQTFKLQEWRSEEPAQSTYQKLWGQLNLKPKLVTAASLADSEHDDWSLVD